MLENFQEFLRTQGYNTATYINVDPAGIEPTTLDIYTDDGFGNGNLITRFLLSDCIEMEKRCQETLKKIYF